MKIVYATNLKATDIHAWSGLGWYYPRMLEQAGCEVTTIDKTDMPRPYLSKFRRHLVKNVQQKIYSPHFSLAVSKYYANRIHQEVAPGAYIFSPNTIILAHLKKSLKKVLYADATFDSLLKLYPSYKHLTAKCLAEGDEIDRRAVANADLLLYTSQWAADSSINHYGADPAKIFVVPFGANLDRLPSANEVKGYISSRLRTRRINLLFLGIDWVRKGGDYALQVTSKLNELGFSATLHIVGAHNLPPHISQQSVINHGFISKATPEGQRAISALLASSHFLLLPTLADCTPVACSEANAFGVPCLTSDVGGLKSVIKNEINGHTFAHSNFVEDVVSYIINLMETENAYKALACSSYNQYATELNWKSVGQKIMQIIKTI